MVGLLCHRFIGLLVISILITATVRPQDQKSILALYPTCEIDQVAGGPYVGSFLGKNCAIKSDWNCDGPKDSQTLDFISSINTMQTVYRSLSVAHNVAHSVGEPKRKPPDTSASPTSQCNKAPEETPYSDCDMKFSIIGGVEQSAQSSLPSSTDPFIRVFTRAGPDFGNPEAQRFYLWGSIRLLGAPQASSTNGVVSAVTDPAGNITTQNFSGIGNSIDFMVGAEYVLAKKPGTRMYSFSAIAGYGGTTPLTANSLNQAFKSPGFGTVECNTLLSPSRFGQQFRADNIIAGTNSNAATPACLVNANSVTSAPTTTPVTYTPITTIGFSNQDRTNFLGKAVVGIRAIDRFVDSNSSACGDLDTSKKIAPCSRGFVDFLVGQDASVTGGKMRHFVFKIDGVHPLPVKSVSFLYLFGSVTIRFTRNINYAPLVLQSGDVTSLTGNGSNAVPNTSVVVLPLTQPDRDFYRFGAGVDIANVFKKLFSSGTQTATTTGSQ